MMTLIWRVTVRPDHEHEGWVNLHGVGLISRLHNPSKIYLVKIFHWETLQYSMRLNYYLNVTIFNQLFYHFQLLHLQTHHYYYYFAKLMSTNWKRSGVKREAWGRATHRGPKVIGAPFFSKKKSIYVCISKKRKR